MANTYGLASEDEKKVRARDTRCVYCHKIMEQPPFKKGGRNDWATIEHFDNDGPLDVAWNVGICCWACNSSKGIKTLRAWFNTSYCMQRKITEHTVAAPVKEYLRKVGASLGH